MEAKTTATRHNSLGEASQSKGHCDRGKRIYFKLPAKQPYIL